MNQSTPTKQRSELTLQARYSRVVLSFIGLLVWLTVFGTRETNPEDISSLLPLLLLAIPITALVKASLHQIDVPADLGPTLLAGIGLGLLLAAHYANLA